MLYKQYITGVLLVHYCKAIIALLHFHHYTIVVNDSITLLQRHCHNTVVRLVHYYYTIVVP